VDDCAYNPETKQVYIRFDRTMIMIDLEDFMDVIYTLQEMKEIIKADPDVTLGEFEDEDGNSWEEFIVKGKDEEYC
jgi:hypothetical protein